MLSYFDLRKGVKFILDEQPCEVLGFEQIKMAQRKEIIIFVN
jgi:translation elongation factor P/translation initiation factor 5A